MVQFTGRRWAVLLFFTAFVTNGSRSGGADIPMPMQPQRTDNFEKMRQGRIPPDKEELANLAKWLAHRLVHPPYNGVDPESLRLLMDEGDKRWFRFPNPTAAPNALQLDYGKEFGKAMEYELMYVMTEATQRLEKVNAARMLALVGKLPYEGLADTYLKIIKEDKYPPEIKLYAFEGLRNLLAIPSPNDFTNPDKQFLERSPKLSEIAVELDKFITRPLPPDLSNDDIRVIQFVRREAVRALAQIKVNVIRQQQETLARPIWTLLRVATNDSIVGGAAGKQVDETIPGYPYHVLERIEAVIGICSMIPDRALNVELVAYLIDEALVDITVFHAAERARLLKDQRNKPLVPWSIMAARLTEAMNLWKDRSAQLKIAGAPAVAGLFNLATLKTLSKLEKDGVSAVPDNRQLITWKNDHKPKSMQVIAEDESTTVKIK